MSSNIKNVCVFTNKGEVLKIAEACSVYFGVPFGSNKFSNELCLTIDTIHGPIIFEAKDVTRFSVEIEKDSKYLHIEGAEYEHDK